MSKLREALGDGARLNTRSPGYVLELEPTQLDVARFRQLARVGRTELGDDPALAAKILQEALDLWRGPALADFEYDDFVSAERSSLSELRLAVLGDRIDADLATGRHADLIGKLEEPVLAHGFHERFWGQLMIALYRAGRQADALRAYRRARTLLGDELGIERSPSMQKLEQQILLQVPELEAPPTGTGPIGLPSFVSDFIGRSDELAALSELLDANRLLTLAGPGGIGKTRTAVEVARVRGDRYRHGVRMIDLAPVVDSDGVAQVFADDLDVPAAANRHLADVVTEHLSAKEMLLIVDNCEQVLDGAAQLVRRVLEAWRH